MHTKYAFYRIKGAPQRKNFKARLHYGKGGVMNTQATRITSCPATKGLGMKLYSIAVFLVCLKTPLCYCYSQEPLGQVLNALTAKIESRFA